MAGASTYYDKVFREPEYIWHAGSSNSGLVETTIEDQHVRRLQWLASSEPVRADILPGQRSGTNNVIQPVQPAPDYAALQDFSASAANLSLSSSRAGRNVVVPLLSLVWNGAEPQNYQAQFRIGTDPLPFLLDLDTGSSLLWVQSRLSDTDPGVADQSQYNPRSSKTAAKANREQKVSYGDGSSVNATIFTDNVAIGDLLARDQYVGAVSTSNLSSGAIQGKSNGLIGLGFAPGKIQGFVQTLQQQGLIKYASITLVGPRSDPDQAKVIHEEDIMEPRGHLIIGSVDEKFYTGNIAWCPQIPGFDAAVSDRWIVRLDKVFLNGVALDELQDQYALIDTGTSYIVTSPSNMTTFRRKIPGARPTSKLYTWAYPQGAVKSISFQLGGRVIELHPSDFDLGDLKPDSQGVVRTLSSICTLPNNSWPFSENLWVLGGIFIDNVVTIFDFDGRRVGIADISERDLDQDVAKG